MTAMTATSSTNAMPADFLATVNPKAKAAVSSMDESQDRFLKLLTTQLKNQDPMNPMDNAQMTSQMAQISTVNGIEKLNSTLQKMMNSTTDAQTLQAAQMLGRQVLVSGSGLTLAEGAAGAVGGFELPQVVDTATLTISDSGGTVVRTLQLGNQPAGLQDFAWDGMNDAGEAAVPGRYTFSVKAEQSGEEVSATTLEMSPVTGVLREASGVRFELGQLGNFSLADIRQIY